jgi:RNA polymerase sigma-70 factor (ECF subfamily)
LFAEHNRFVHALCLRRLQDQLDAEDAAQETFMRALLHPGVFQSPKAWLATVADHICTDEIRRRKRRHALSAALESELRTLDSANAQEREIDLGDWLHLLTRSERRVIANTVLRDKSHSATSMALGIAESTSRVLHSRAIQKLRDHMYEGVVPEDDRVIGGCMPTPSVSATRRGTRR